MAKLTKQKRQSYERELAFLRATLQKENDSLCRLLKAQLVLDRAICDKRENRNPQANLEECHALVATVLEILHQEGATSAE